MSSNDYTKVLFKAVPLTIIGIALCLTLLLMPFGIALIIYACRPLSKLQVEAVRRQFKAAQSAQSAQSSKKYEEEPLPGWIIEGLPDNTDNTDK